MEFTDPNLRDNGVPTELEKKVKEDKLNSLHVGALFRKCLQFLPPNCSTQGYQESTPNFYHIFPNINLSFYITYHVKSFKLG